METALDLRDIDMVDSAEGRSRATVHDQEAL